MVKYEKFKKMQEALVSEFPQFFAFSEEQFEEGLKKLNVKREDVLSTRFGGFIRRSDKEAYKLLWLTIGKQEDEFLKDKKNFVEALVYELGNHEHAYSHDATDTLNCFNLEWETMTEEQKEMFAEAEKIYMNSQEW